MIDETFIPPLPKILPVDRTQYKWRGPLGEPLTAMTEFKGSGFAIQWEVSGMHGPISIVVGYIPGPVCEDSEGLSSEDRWVAKVNSLMGHDVIHGIGPRDFMWVQLNYSIRKQWEASYTA